MEHDPERADERAGPIRQSEVLRPGGPRSPENPLVQLQLLGIELLLGQAGKPHGPSPHCVAGRRGARSCRIMSAAFSPIMIVGRVRVAARDPRHDRGVHHAEPADAMNAQLCVDHGHRVRTHLAGAGLVPGRVAVPLAVVEKLLVGRRRRARRHLGHDAPGHRLGCKNPTQQAQPMDGALDVALVAQIVRVEGRRLQWIRGGQVQVPDRVGPDQDHRAADAGLSIHGHGPVRVERRRHRPDRQLQVGLGLFSRASHVGAHGR